MPSKFDGTAWKVRKTFLEVNLNRLKQNYRLLRKSAKGRELLLVIKSNAYGHSAIPVAKALEGESALHGFAVATIEEAIELRRARIKKPLYVLSGVQEWNEEVFRCVRDCDLMPVISSLRVFRQLSAFARSTKAQISFQLKFNSGMNRLGLAPAEVADVVTELRRTPSLQLVGLMSHFASAELPKAAITKKQIAVFRSVIAQFAAAGISPRYVHMENSSGFENQLLPEANIARIGLHLYGIENPSLTPIARWVAQIFQVRELERGESVGYGSRFKAKRKMRMAVLGVGYADGFHRLLSNRAQVLVQGKRCPVIGSISMDLTAIDISKIASVNPSKDRAILLGRDGKEQIRAEELARHAETISWEIMTSISPRVPRVFIA